MFTWRRRGETAVEDLRFGEAERRFGDVLLLLVVVDDEEEATA